MTPLFYCFAAMVALAGLLGTIGIWSPRRLWVKGTALAVVAAFLPAAYVGYAELLSRPKPAQLELLRGQLTEAGVIGMDLREDEAIYLWLRLEGTNEPRAYVLDWDEQRARELHEAQRGAEANGTEVRMRKPFAGGGGDREPVFYAEPQRALPPKHVNAGQLTATSY